MRACLRVQEAEPYSYFACPVAVPLHELCAAVPTERSTAFEEELHAVFIVRGNHKRWRGLRRCQGEFQTDDECAISQLICSSPAKCHTTLALRIAPTPGFNTLSDPTHTPPQLHLLATSTGLLALPPVITQCRRVPRTPQPAHGAESHG